MPQNNSYAPNTIILSTTANQSTNSSHDSGSIATITGKSISNINSSLLSNVTKNFTGNFNGDLSSNFIIISGNSTFTPKNITYVGSSLPDIIGVITAAPSKILDVIIQYKYISLFVLMLSDGAALPPPSEFVMPPAGFLARQGYLSFGFGFLIIMIANLIGLSFDYIIAYKVGEYSIYKNIHWLHIKKKDLRAFENWFKQNGEFAVFVSRLVPELRVLINFPAGFVKMPYKVFLFYSVLGIFLYNYLLMLFGFYLLSETNSLIVASFAGVFTVAIYYIYAFAAKKIGIGIKKRKRSR